MRGVTHLPITKPHESRAMLYYAHEFRVGGELVVSYTERGGVLRLISSREVTPAERQAYEEG